MENCEAVTVGRTLALIQSIPGDERRLMALLLSLSKNGRNRVYARAEWYWRALEVSRATYYRWRAKLEAMGLVTVTQRKEAPRYNRTSLIGVCSLKTIVTRMWRAVQRRMCLTDETHLIPVPYNSKPIVSQKLQKEGLGMEKEQPEQLAVELAELAQKRKSDEKQARLEAVREFARSKRRFRDPAEVVTYDNDGKRQWASPALLKMLR